MPDWKERKASLLLLCNDIEKTFGELESKGVNFTQEPKKMLWSTYAIFADVDGNRFIIKG